MIGTILIFAFPLSLLISGVVCFITAITEKNKIIKKMKNDEDSRMDNIV